jgi:hypothetical protein
VDRTTTFIAVGVYPNAVDGVWSYKKYSSVPILASTPPCFTSLATPMIVKNVLEPVC